MINADANIRSPFDHLIRLPGVVRVPLLMLAAIILGFTGILLAKGTETRPDASEAAAAIFSAVVGIIGVHLGHRAQGRAEHNASILLALVAAAGILGALSFWVSSVFGISFPAAATVSLSALSLASVHAFHAAGKKRWNADTWIGLGLVLLGFILGIAAVIRVPESAEGWAAVIVAGFITTGGSYLGHFGS